ncbi:MAG: homoserine O-acetyltransferase [Candidatus Altiarchaeota archaeon]
MGKRNASVGVVKTQSYTFEKLRLDSGKTLSPVTISYETYGKLNKDKSNAIFICHALSGDAHAAGKHRKNSRRNGWYDIAIGPGKTFDTRKYFVICANVIGGCKGSTGPSSVNPKTGEPYGIDFPTISVRDMVRAHKKLVDHLGIKKLFAITGGSLGGMQVLEWARTFPESVHLAIPIACAAKQYPMNIVFNELGRKAIIADENWKCGKYYDNDGTSNGRGKNAGGPRQGLAIARQIGHVTYLSQDTLERKFGRKRKNGKSSWKFRVDFEIQSYFNYQGKSFVSRFDANSYLYITHAIDQFDLTEGGAKKLKDVFEDLKSKFLIVSFTSDWLYPPEQNQEVFAGLAEAGVKARYENLDIPYGHDSFLVYNNTLGNVLLEFLEEESKEYFDDTKGKPK